MTNILVTGANGQLGLTIASLKEKYADYNFFFAKKSALNIANAIQVENYILKNNIEVIINCAAYTQVDKAEDESNLANEINHLAVKNLAEVTKKYAVKLIHISTDYVFDGNKKIPYSEEDATNPQNSYGKSKLAGENALLNINPKNSIIIRTSWLYSEFGHNFVKTILKISKQKKEIQVVNNQFGTPTNAKDLAEVILTIIPKINTNNIQIYHYANQGTCSWFRFAQEIVTLSSNNCVVMPILAKDFKVKAVRPNFSMLNTNKIQNTFGIDIPNWQDSLKECICEL